MEEDDLDRAKDRELILVSRGLAAIKDAIAIRPENGAVVACEDCGDAIPVARLKAAPFTSRCVDCQSESERERA